MPNSDPVQDFLNRLTGVRQTAADQWQARCPAHDDQHASLCIGRGEDGRVLIKCQAGCSSMQVCRALNLPMRELFPPQSSQRQPERIVAVYDYRDAAGELLFQCVRFEPKNFRQRRPMPDGHWAWGLSAGQYYQRSDGDWHKVKSSAPSDANICDLPECPRMLYRLPEVAKADPAKWLFVVEGEKDADNLFGIGLTATSSPMGAGNWGKLSDDSVLHGKRIAILPDKDSPGRKHAIDVAGRLYGKATELKIVELPGDGKDVSDWIKAGGTADALLSLAESAVSYDPLNELQNDVLKQDAVLVKLGQHDPETGRLVLSPRKTLPTADAFLTQFYDHPDGRTLHCHAGVFLAWRDNRYCEMEDQAVRSQIQPWLHEAMRYVVNRKTGEYELVDFESNPTTINAALESIRIRVHLSASTSQPAWLDGKSDHPKPDEILPCKSNNLHIPTAQILPATPALFVTNALDFDYDPNAAAPALWLNFLRQLWDDDGQSIELLQEWMGYCLTADTAQQKMLLLVGPKRSGKGTIGRVLTRLIGPANVCGPTIGSLAGAFGLQSLIGRSLAVVSDARFSGDDVAIVAERLLCISGEDFLTIDRKFLQSITIKLPTRFVFLANELPRMNDASGALANRFLILRLAKSFYGQEDMELTDKLVKELPGILLWALQGWVRLRGRGRFIQPVSSADALMDLEDLSSPVGAFVRERCEVGEGKRAFINDLYEEYKKWCAKEGRTSPVTRQTFGRDLAAAVPGLVTRRNNDTGRFYEGITLIGVTQ